MRRHLLIAVLAGGCLLAAACGDDGATASEGGTVVVTTPVLGDIVENLVGDLATVEVLMPRGADPHQFQPSARQVVTLGEADLAVVNGGGLEAGLDDAIETAADDGVPVFTAVDHVETLVADATGDAGDEGGADGHSGDDGHDHDVDPHITTDQTRMIDVTTALADTLAAEVPGLDTDAFRDRADAYIAELHQLDREVTLTIARIPDDRRLLVTEHRVFGYFADRYGFRIVGAVIPSTTSEATPSARDLDDLAAAVADHDVPAIFVEAGSDGRLARTLADEVGGVEVVELYGETLGEPGSGTDTYIGMIRTNATRIADALAPS